MARIVTGSVAESVAPMENASTKEMLKPSRGIRVQRYSNTPKTTAEIKVPAKAKVRIVPMFRKKFALIDRSAKCCKTGLGLTYLVQFIPGSEDYGRQKKIEEILIVEADRFLNGGPRSKSYNKSHDHTWSVS